MARPTQEDARALRDWRPPLGVVSIYLRFDPSDRGGAWRTELRNGLDRALEAAKEAEHERRLALRATVKRLAERFEDGERRPPPRGEAGFVEVAERPGTERWWQVGVPAAVPAMVRLDPEPVLAPLVELSCLAEPRGVALLSAERVRLLGFAEGGLEGIEDWELSITSLDWRERKSPSARNPARAQNVGSSGHDQFGERLDHNRHRFLGECGQLAGARLAERGIREIVVFGPAVDLESFEAGIAPSGVRLAVGGDGDLISTPTGQLTEPVAAAIGRLCAEWDRALVERVLEAARGGSRGAAGAQETAAALAEGRVEHLVFDAAIGEPAEALVRGALTGGSRITVVRGEAAEPLASAEGAAALLRY